MSPRLPPLQHLRPGRVSRAQRPPQPPLPLLLSPDVRASSEALRPPRLVQAGHPLRMLSRAYRASSSQWLLRVSAICRERSTIRALTYLRGSILIDRALTPGSAGCSGRLELVASGRSDSRRLINNSGFAFRRRCLVPLLRWHRESMRCECDVAVQEMVIVKVGVRTRL